MTGSRRSRTPATSWPVARSSRLARLAERRYLAWRQTIRRLSRYDPTGLIWLLRGRPVVAPTTATAAIENPTGAVTIYGRQYRGTFEWGVTLSGLGAAFSRVR
jgi:hypothetical protein